MSNLTTSQLLLSRLIKPDSTEPLTFEEATVHGTRIYAVPVTLFRGGAAAANAFSIDINLKLAPYVRRHRIAHPDDELVNYISMQVGHRLCFEADALHLKLYADALLDIVKDSAKSQTLTPAQISMHAIEDIAGLPRGSIIQKLNLTPMDIVLPSARIEESLINREAFVEVFNTLASNAYHGRPDELARRREEMIVCYVDPDTKDIVFSPPMLKNAKMVNALTGTAADASKIVSLRHDLWAPLPAFDPEKEFPLIVRDSERNKLFQAVPTLNPNRERQETANNEKWRHFLREQSSRQSPHAVQWEVHNVDEVGQCYVSVQPIQSAVQILSSLHYSLTYTPRTPEERKADKEKKPAKGKPEQKNDDDEFTAYAPIQVDPPPPFDPEIGNSQDDRLKILRREVTKDGRLRIPVDWVMNCDKDIATELANLSSIAFTPIASTREY